MTLTRVEKARITDSRQKVQTVAESLKHVDPAKIPDLQDIADCLEDAERSLDQALRNSGSRVSK